MSETPMHFDGATGRMVPFTPEQVAQRAADAAADTARAVPVRTVLGSTLRATLKTMPGAPRAAFDVALAAESQDTRDWWTDRYSDLVPETAVKLVRICAAAQPPISVRALYDAALAG